MAAELHHHWHVEEVEESVGRLHSVVGVVLELGLCCGHDAGAQPPSEISMGNFMANARGGTVGGERDHVMPGSRHKSTAYCRGSW